ncbi:MAG: hypothetical protein AAGG06_19355, partial [Pseudomonadota bacterium]
MPQNIGPAPGSPPKGPGQAAAPDAPHAKIKANALDVLKPRFMPDGSPYRRAMYKGADIGASDTAIFKLDRTIQKRLDYKVKRLSSWFVKKFSDVAKREQDVASLKTWQAAAKDFGSAITRYHDLKLDHEAMRRLPIPHDTAARDALLEKLQANTRALHTAVLSIRTSHTALLERTDERAELMNKTGVAMDSKRRTDIKQARVLIDKAMSGVIAGDLAE